MILLLSEDKGLQLGTIFKQFVRWHFIMLCNNVESRHLKDRSLTCCTSNNLLDKVKVAKSRKEPKF